MLTPDYQQFVQAEPPADGLTVSAWRGVIQPYSDDAAARSILCDIEAERTLWISAGSIRPGASTESHWAHPLLVNMAAPCEVMVCTQPDAVPRAYLLSPRYQPYYADTAVHPHPRSDQTIDYSGRPLPGLCVFSSAEFRFVEDADYYTQFLDQLTQYVAKHLVWLRTRRLCRKIGHVVTPLYQPLPGEAIVEDAPRFQWVQTRSGPARAMDFWSGYWPGRSAKAMTPAEHLRQIKPTLPCWCGRHKMYGECHRNRDSVLAGEQEHP